MKYATKTSDFHPFAYPTIDEILGPGCINWTGNVSRGLDDSPDIIHEANYGACMAAPRADMIAIGGADEHLDYLGYICGPYDMTFRLVNQGLPERWLRDEYLYHVWHPNIGSSNNDYQGPSDGRGMSARSLESRLIGRVEPCQENPWIRQARLGAPPGVEQLLTLLAEREEPSWRPVNNPPRPMPCSWSRPTIAASTFFGTVVTGMPCQRARVISIHASLGVIVCCSTVRRWPTLPTSSIITTAYQSRFGADWPTGLFISYHGGPRS